MPKFGYVAAHSLAEALELLNEPGVVSRPLAGGTDVMVLVRLEQPSFDRVVDITRLPELKVIELQGDEIHLGGGVTFTEAAESPLLQEHAPGLVEACLSVGGPQVRNAGTLGGNAVNAAACADSLPALACFDAVAHISGPHGGTRSLSVSDLAPRPHHSDVKSGELLTHFSFPLLPHGTRSTFIKLGRRNAQAISRLSMAAAGRVTAAGRIDFVRLAPGAATPRPRRFKEVEEILLGQLLTDRLLERAGELTATAMIAETGHRWSTEYKEVAIQALAERALRQVLCA
jgi:CO/xanthine dehydrogenase FAD-binding subunit